MTGLTSVDAQHHQLVDLINRFGALVTRPDEALDAQIEIVFGELADYANYHFSEEEELMAALALDPRYIQAHHQSHADFLKEVTLLHDSTLGNNRQAAKSLLQFLTHWLAHHILGQDQHMARQIAAIRSGRSPQEAYLEQGLALDPATDTLLEALNGLFEQVSQRNRELVLLNKNLEARVAERTQALSEANQRLQELANTDVLTGLPNRRSGMHSLGLQWELAQRQYAPLACMMVDADGFKQINDRYGHEAGDLVLRALSAQLRDAVRTDDIVCRLGGDEFLIICPHTTQEGAMQLAESVRRQVATLCVPAGAGQWQGSISVGVASRRPAMTSLEDLVKVADLGVYEAKRNGRNCVAAGPQ